MSMWFYRSALENQPADIRAGASRIYIFLLLSFMTPFSVYHLHNMAQIRGFLPGATFVSYPVTRLWTTSGRYNATYYRVAWDAGMRSSYAITSDDVPRQYWDTLHAGSVIEVACFPDGRDHARMSIAADAESFAFDGVICLLELWMIGSIIRVIILTRQEAVRAITECGRERARVDGSSTDDV
jgi:hypothetical protein